MITFLKGQLVKSGPNKITIDVGGIGYLVMIPLNIKLPQLGTTILLHTSHVIREQSQTLYGFLIEQERDLFEKIHGVNGIGPKIALSLISHLPKEKFYSAISNKDLDSICRVPGIGKKTAERLVIEMRDRFGKGHHPSEFSIPIDSPHTQKMTDAVNALMNLGYTLNIAQRAVEKSLKDQPDSIELAELITHALKNV